MFATSQPVAMGMRSLLGDVSKWEESVATPTSPRLMYTLPQVTSPRLMYILSQVTSRKREKRWRLLLADASEQLTIIPAS